MCENGKLDIITLLETIADNKFLLGDQLVEIGISGPDLQASLASTALAQAELGHARHLYNWSYELQGIDKEVTEQSGKGFPEIMEMENWIELMTWLYIINVATKIVMKALYESGKTDTIKRVPKMVRELDEPIAFGSEWCRTFVQETGAIPRIFQETFRNASQRILSWLEDVENAEYLQESGYLKSCELVSRYRNEISEFQVVLAG